MKPNLDTLKAEIENYIEDSGLVVFHGCAREMDSMPAVYWDVGRHPDYKMFIKTAQDSGAKLIVLHPREFDSAQLDDGLEQLAECGLTEEEQRDFEQRLGAMRVYDGFICGIELSFDHQGRIFVFDLRTDWYNELSDILDEIQLLTVDTDEDDDSPIGGYFSRN